MAKGFQQNFILIIKSTFFNIKMALKIPFQPCIGLYSYYFSFSVKKKNPRRFEKRTGEFSLLFQYSEFQSTSVFCLSFSPILIVKSTFFSIKRALNIPFQPCIGLYAYYFSFSVKKKNPRRLEIRTGEFSLHFQYFDFQSTFVFCLSFGRI